MKNLLHNNPVVDLTEETDYFNLIPKGNVIADFLNNTIDDPLKFKMLCVYGSWGSGKSTLMHYLQKRLNEAYNCYFFESWEYEKDENLAYSLLEFFTLKAVNATDQKIKEILSLGKRILKGLAKGVSLNLKLGPVVDLKFSGKDVVEELEHKEDGSFHTALAEFKKAFREIENRKNKTTKFNIIFIDDLDRCEPEQILNLLSAIKLFFTYGEKTIFFCGIDRTAVETAILHKYGNHIKSQEYLEKIFDFYFTMPKNVDISKLINVYFDDQPVWIEDNQGKLHECVAYFFKELRFTNPRKLKKVMNSFTMFRLFLQSNPKPSHPLINLQDGSKQEWFEIALCLYLIIIKEFYPAEFDNFLNFDRKREVYIRKIDPRQKDQMLNYLDVNYADEAFDSIRKNRDGIHIQTTRFFACLTPTNVETITTNAFFTQQTGSLTVKDDTIDFLFYKHINSFSPTHMFSRTNSQASISGIKKLIEDFL